VTRLPSLRHSLARLKEKLMTVTATGTATLTPIEIDLDTLLNWAEIEYKKQVQGLPSEWDQGHWAIRRPDGTPVNASCATACCLAGKTVALDGGRFILDTDYGQGFQGAFFAEMPDGQRVDVEAYAASRLSLTKRQARALFDGDNTIHDVRRIIADLKEDPDAEPHGADYNPEDDDYDY